MKGFLLQPTYRVRSGVPVVQLFGRSEEGPAFVVEDDRFRPYFFVRDEPAATAALKAEPGVRVEPSELRDLAGAAVLRLECALPGDVPQLRERLGARGVRPLEADVRFPHRYLIDRGLRAGLEIDGAAQMDGGLARFRNPTLRPADVRPALRVLSLDLETSPDASRLYSAALAGCGVEEVLLLSARPVGGAHVFADERALARALLERLRELDPDVIVGWNVVDFDLRVLERRVRALGLPPELGRAPGETRFVQDPGFQRQSRAEIPGRVVLDGVGLARESLRLVDYRLETVARAVLGRGKKIDQDAPDAAAEIARLFREDPEALVAYNLEDARLVLDILEREGLLALAVERSALSGMPLDRVSASVASFDRLYLPELRRRGRVAPSVDRERADAGAEVVGGALLEPTPGFFRRVAVFDFKSLYPSLIRTFQLDPLAHAEAAGAEPDAVIVAPNGARFAREGAILPGVIDAFLASREAAKRRGDPHADAALKIMMNAFFGVLGTPACRFFDPAVANAITSFGQQTLRWTRDAFEAAGNRVLYGDTDSVFVQLHRDAPDEAEALRAAVEAEVSARIEREYAASSKLSLELELVFDRFFLPRVRGGRGGSKKRYAGWVGDADAGRLVVVGLESVRRDWPAVARRLQQGLLERVFQDREAELMPFVSELVARVRAGELDPELVYAKRIRKGAVERYTDAVPPHVQAARKAGRTAGGVIRYVITETGPEPAPPRRPLPPGIDRRHYVERVLRPVADAILLELGSSFDEAIGEATQLPLL
ncbi:MAG TPA: DNA polymerase II [Myxococcota bacterium]|nr:DNA polymerase II [Myxococcota bacterium]